MVWNKAHTMVLERSFDSAELKRLLVDSEMVVDRSLVTRDRQHSLAKINRPPLPKGSQVFEKVLEEFQPERLCPEIRVTTGSSTTTTATLALPASHHHGDRLGTDAATTHLRPYSGRPRSSSPRSDPHRQRPGSIKVRKDSSTPSVSRQGSARAREGPPPTAESGSVSISSAQ